MHPQSLVHAIVGFCDGGMLAHLGPPDMRHAIGYALNYPNRKTLPLEKLDFTKVVPSHLWSQIKNVFLQSVWHMT
ncbi:MAG: hypothetical protein CM15mP54_06300 [Paracoccaceae bacterium]|nr:MAG: hypothetical protein CM15mP54_06300 [Paracoccaceae bacterium]